MKVYVYSPPDETYILAQDAPEALNAFEILSFPAKISALESWKPMPVRIIWEPGRGHRRRRVRADIPSPNFTSLAFGRRAKNALEPFLNLYGELLPLECTEEEFWILNVTNVIDALDLDRSEILDREHLDPMCPDIVRCAFHENKIGKAALFRVPQTNVNDTFFTDAFIDEVNRHGLTGLGWRCEWEGKA